LYETSGFPSIDSAAEDIPAKSPLLQEFTADDGEILPDDDVDGGFSEYEEDLTMGIQPEQVSQIFWHYHSASLFRPRKEQKFICRGKILHIMSRAVDPHKP